MSRYFTLHLDQFKYICLGQFSAAQSPSEGNYSLLVLYLDPLENTNALLPRKYSDLKTRQNLEGILARKVKTPLNFLTNKILFLHWIVTSLFRLCRLSVVLSNK